MADIDRLLRGTLQMRGSDLHLASEQMLRVRVRGDLQVVGSAPTPCSMVAGLVKEILTPEQAAEFEAEQELDFTYAAIELKARFRVNLFLNRFGPAAVFRVVPAEVPTVEQLQVPESVVRFTGLDRGLVLVTGATGSGKSTTLAALVDYINRSYSQHILTLEDPIEFVHASKRSLVNQREIGVHSKSFSRALKGALREDPDVILVGEMRDLETIELALTAAETGHLVFGTLHTASAAKTVDRIINVFPGERQEQIRTLVSESLKGVVAQQLLKSVDGGRVAAMEIMAVNPAIANLIREGKTFQIASQIQMGRAEGMQTMDQALEALRRSGRISDEVYAEVAPPPPRKAPISAVA